MNFTFACESRCSEESKKNQLAIRYGIIIVASMIIMLTFMTIMHPRFREPSFNRLEREFLSNQEEFNIVVEYILDIDIEEAMILRVNQADDTSNIMMWAGLEVGEIYVGDEKVAEAISILFQTGYHLITRGEHGIMFQRWAIRNRGVGIAYSVNEDASKLILEHWVIEVIPFDDERWNFYISDYREWRRRISN